MANTDVIKLHDMMPLPSGNPVIITAAPKK